ncbi:hypothetical protein GTO82_00760 [Lactobacillus johnsonii]|uniref:Uncharacterized protein n=1 Tax=Lactobacillus johnsonii TaxID=33959 RepID=A0A9X7U0Q4_LACJH|nr:hypothetical protein [Lactobacillus johnsonii]QLL67490.1 hypothetical protein GTO82_00760 [Lactobacillus johnsonii]
MNNAIELYSTMLESRYEKYIQNKWIWIIVALVVFVSVFSYAFYCTSRGYSFTGNVKLGWPKVWEMGIGCKR